MSNPFTSGSDSDEEVTFPKVQGKLSYTRRTIPDDRSDSMLRQGGSSLSHRMDALPRQAGDIIGDAPAAMQRSPPYSTSEEHRLFASPTVPSADRESGRGGDDRRETPSSSLVEDHTRPKRHRIKKRSTNL